MAEETTSVDGGSSDEIPAWLLDEGKGLEANMEGDPRPQYGPRRFWMPKGEKRIIIFLTEGDKFKTVWEHNLKIGNGPRAWQNWCSCVQPLGIDCPICQWADTHDNQYARYKISFATIIDTTEYIDKKGKKWVNQRNLFGAKKDTVEILKLRSAERKEDGGSLRFAMYQVYRTNSEKSASVGEDFSFRKMIDPAVLPPESTQEFKYAEVLKPDLALCKLLLKKATAYAASVGGGGRSDASPSDADPFKDVRDGEGTDAKVKY